MKGRIRQLSPPLSFRPHPSLVQPVLVLRELREEAGSHLEVRSPGIQKFEGLEETPSESTHNEGSNDEARSILGFAGLNENGLLVINSFFHELVDLIRDFFL